MIPRVFRITTRQDVDDLISDIRAAAKRSSHNGAEYGVYRKDAEGKYPVAISIHQDGNDTPGRKRIR